METVFNVPLTRQADAQLRRIGMVWGGRALLALASSSLFLSCGAVYFCGLSLLLVFSLGFVRLQYVRACGGPTVPEHVASIEKLDCKSSYQVLEQPKQALARFSELPPALLTHCFEFLGTREVCSAEVVCSDWLACACLPLIWVPLVREWEEEVETEVAHYLDTPWSTSYRNWREFERRAMQGLSDAAMDHEFNRDVYLSDTLRELRAKQRRLVLPLKAIVSKHLAGSRASQRLRMWHMERETEQLADRLMKRCAAVIVACACLLILWLWPPLTVLRLLFPSLGDVAISTGAHALRLSPWVFACLSVWRDHSSILNPRLIVFLLIPVMMAESILWSLNLSTPHLRGAVATLVRVSLIGRGVWQIVRKGVNRLDTIVVLGIVAAIEFYMCFLVPPHAETWSRFRGVDPVRRIMWVGWCLALWTARLAGHSWCWFPCRHVIILWQEHVMGHLLHDRSLYPAASVRALIMGLPASAVVEWAVYYWDIEMPHFENIATSLIRYWSLFPLLFVLFALVYGKSQVPRREALLYLLVWTLILGAFDAVFRWCGWETPYASLYVLPVLLAMGRVLCHVFFVLHTAVPSLNRSNAVYALQCAFGVVLCEICTHLHGEHPALLMVQTLLAAILVPIAWFGAGYRVCILLWRWQQTLQQQQQQRDRSAPSPETPQLTLERRTPSLTRSLLACLQILCVGCYDYHMHSSSTTRAGYNALSDLWFGRSILNDMDPAAEELYTALYLAVMVKWITAFALPAYLLLSCDLKAHAVLVSVRPLGWPKWRFAFLPWACLFISLCAVASAGAVHEPWYVGYFGAWLVRSHALICTGLVVLFLNRSLLVTSPWYYVSIFVVAAQTDRELDLGLDLGASGPLLDRMDRQLIQGQRAPEPSLLTHPRFISLHQLCLNEEGRLRPTTAAGPWERALGGCAGLLVLFGHEYVLKMSPWHYGRSVFVMHYGHIVVELLSSMCILGWVCVPVIVWSDLWLIIQQMPNSDAANASASLSTHDSARSDQQDAREHLQRKRRELGRMQRVGAWLLALAALQGFTALISHQADPYIEGTGSYVDVTVDLLAVTIFVGSLCAAYADLLKRTTITACSTDGTCSS